jgi:heme O synthase-like polyprenyltransferase
MHGFILEFYNTKFYVILLVIYVMKWNLLTPMLVLCDFIFFETVYTQFHIDETHLLSFFINSLSYHQNILCGRSFIENKISIESSLTFVWIGIHITVPF